MGQAKSTHHEPPADCITTEDVFFCFSLVRNVSPLRMQVDGPLQVQEILENQKEFADHCSLKPLERRRNLSQLEENAAFHEFGALKSRLDHVFQQQKLLIPISTAFFRAYNISRIPVWYRCGTEALRKTLLLRVVRRLQRRRPHQRHRQWLGRSFIPCAQNFLVES